MPKEVEDMVQALIKRGHSKDSAWAIATAARKKKKKKKKKKGY